MGNSFGASLSNFSLFLSMMQQKDRISVCICTYRRNAMLRRLLRDLASQQTGKLFEISAVVVDNDSAKSARDTILELQKELPLPITYGMEEERTIPAARNHALRLADGNYIAIIDDDEFPSSDWLLMLYQGIQRFGADGALGPVHPSFEEQPPAWLIRSGFCARPLPPTGTTLRWDQTRTGNVLLKRGVFDRLLFDETLRTGGSDREFFKNAMQAGFRFVSVIEAPVYETLPPERWTRRYYLRRALVNGSNAYRNQKGEVRGLGYLLVPLKSAMAAFVYAIAAPFSLLVGNHAFMNCVVRGGHHFSRLCAMAGLDLVKRRDF